MSVLFLNNKNTIIIIIIIIVTIIVIIVVIIIIYYYCCCCLLMYLFCGLDLYEVRTTFEVLSSRRIYYILLSICLRLVKRNM